jgi:hypothetical protein
MRFKRLILFVSLVFNQLLVQAEEPLVNIVEGSELLNETQTSLIMSDVFIQYKKIETLLGMPLEDFVKEFSFRIVAPERVLEISGLDQAKAVTVDGEIYISSEFFDSTLIRHELLHSVIFALVKSQVPWWIEEGLAQILSGEWDAEQQNIPKSKIEKKYKDARQRVYALVNKSGFKSFGTYLNLIRSGVSEPNAYRIVFEK